MQLVGAHGGRSFVRRALDIGFPGKTLGVRAVVADVTLTGLTVMSGVVSPKVHVTTNIAVPAGWNRSLPAAGTDPAGAARCRHGSSPVACFRHRYYHAGSYWVHLWSVSLRCMDRRYRRLALIGTVIARNYLAYRSGKGQRGLMPLIART